MTAGWRRGGIPSARRPTGRIVVLVAALVVLAIIIAEVAADVVDSGRTAARVEGRTYVTEVLPLVDESNTLAKTMHLARDGAGSLDRTSLERALGDLVAGTSGELTQLASLGVPAPNGRSARLLQATFAERARGARELTGAVAQAIASVSDGRDLAGAALELVVAGRALLASDRDYRDFVASLPRSSGRARLPGSKWVLDAALWAADPATNWVEELASEPRLQVHGRLVIIAVTVEPPVVRITGLPATTTTVAPTTTSTTTTSSVPGVKGTSTTTTSTTTSTSTTTTMQLPPAGSTSVLPPTQSVSVVLVVANAGNVRLSGIWAAASVVAASTGHSAPTRSRAVRVGALLPGSSVVVTLPSLAVSSGRAYTLFASIGTGNLPQGPVTAPPAGLGQTDQVDIRVASG